MRTILVGVAVMAVAFALTRTVEASWSGGNSNCKTTMRMENAGQGTVSKILCSGQCHSPALGWGTCRPLKVGFTNWDHDANGATPPQPMDVYSCGCRFNNPLPEGGYIDVVDTVETSPGNFDPACDAVGFVPEGTTPGTGGVVQAVFCSGECAQPAGGLCLSAHAQRHEVPPGFYWESTCACN